MLQHPLTPPNEDSAETVDIDNGVTLALGSSSPYTQQNSFIATPVSNTHMDLEDQDERAELEDRSDTYDLTDEDQDMSEGGAVLTMTWSHAEELNAELDMLDAEVLGPDNLAGLFQDIEFPPSIMDALYSDSSPHLEESPDISDEMMEDEYSPGAPDASNLPATMSEVSQQLQQIEDGQEHTEFQVAPDDQHAAFINNSTAPFFLLFSSTDSVSPEETPQGQFVSLADISAVNIILAATASQNAPHLWGTEGSTPSSVFDAVVPQTLQLEAHVPVGNIGWEISTDADTSEMEDQFNLSLGDFLENWNIQLTHDEEIKKRSKYPSMSAVHKQRYHENLTSIERRDLQGEKCDIQGIDWDELGVSRLEARTMRRQTYNNYTNLRFPHQRHPRLHGAKLDDLQNYFRFRRMDFDHNIHLSHFQLRNLMACTSRDHVFYAGKSKVIQWNPTAGTKGSRTVAISLTDPIAQPLHAFSGGIQISTMTAAHDILLAGGFSGEYGLVNLKTHKNTKHTEGIITDHLNNITNHVQVHLSRGSSLPLAAFASNDNGMRILDVNTNRFIAEHKYDHAVNCSAISPDQRLRVLVGDSRQVMICNSETGEILQSLEGHRDFGFACDWADDGWTVATGNQDMQIKIWDARKWTTRQGLACPVTTIMAEMAGVRKLKFSPLGSGKKVLMAAEPADLVHAIDADTFSKKQTLSFFGEIGGLDFTNDGQDLFVANCDNMRGGLMEFERCDLASESLYGLKDYQDKLKKPEKYKGISLLGGQGYDWMPTEVDVGKHPKSSGTAEHRRRRAARLGVSMDHF